MKLSGTIGVTQKTMTLDTHVRLILLQTLNPQERWGTHKKRWPFQPRLFADVIGLVRCSYVVSNCLAIDTMKTGQHSECIRPGVNSCSTGFQSRNITILPPESSIYLHGILWGWQKNSKWNQFPVCAFVWQVYLLKYLSPNLIEVLNCGVNCIPSPKNMVQNQVPIGFLTGTVFHRCRAIGLEINASIRTLANHFGMVLKPCK